MADVQRSRRIVTAKEVARALNISRSTVSRALNDSPLVSERTRELVREEAGRLGYQPNRAARSMVRNREYRFAVVMFSDPPHFWEEVSAGVRRAQNELRDYGVHVDTFSVNLHKPHEQVQIIRQLEEEGISGIVVSPANPATLVDPIDRLSERGLPVVTLSSDIPESRRLCHIGCNYGDSGRIAAELMGNFVGRKGKVAMLAFRDIVPAIQDRLVGFRQGIEEFHDIELLGPHLLSRTGEEAYGFVRAYLEKERDVAGIYVSYGILEEVARAVQDAGKGKAIRIVGYDLSRGIAGYIRDQVIDATICHEPFNLGYYSLKMLYKYIVEGVRPRRTIIHTKLEIVTRQNLQYYEDESDYQVFLYDI